MAEEKGSGLGRPEPAGLAQFSVEIEGLPDLWFTGCEGLTAEYTFEEVQQGGNNAFVHRLPGRVKYQNVKLTRLLTGESMKLAAWFSDYQKKRQPRTSATITLWNVTGCVPICRWTLREVYPAKWSGPTFAADGTGVAKETLELAHHGFAWTAK
jgi:phage tail-like protein